MGKKLRVGRLGRGVRRAVCGAEMTAMLATAPLQAATAGPYFYEAPEEKSTDWSWLALPAAIGFVFCLMTDCIGMRRDGSSGGSGSRDAWRMQEGEKPQAREAWPGWGSTSCFWGTVEDGTCIR
jgi:hypothetical protein